MTTGPNPDDGASARTIAKPVRARETTDHPTPPRTAPEKARTTGQTTPKSAHADPDTRPCPRCRDLIPGGPDGWAAHAAGADSAAQAGVDGYAQALAEHRRHSDSTTSGSFVERASRARF